MLRAQNANSVLADVFLYLIVVCSMSKKSLFPWQIPRAEFLIHFQDPISEFHSVVALASSRQSDGYQTCLMNILMVP
jgi:hypothetical protein